MYLFLCVDLSVESVCSRFCLSLLYIDGFTFKTLVCVAVSLLLGMYVHIRVEMVYCTNVFVFCVHEFICQEL